MNKRGLVLLLALLLAGPATAGVVYEVESEDHTDPKAKAETVQMSAEGRHLRLGISSGARDNKGEAIYRGEQQEMILIDHDQKSYMVMDKETMLQMAAQIKSAMAQMEQMLANMPESQREQMKKMMKGRMPMADSEPNPSVLKKTGETAKKAGYPCAEYHILREGQKVREVWVTDWDNVEGGEEVQEIFQEMTEFFAEMIESFSSAGGLAEMGDELLAHWKDMKGFPVLTKEFAEDGGLKNVTTLRSAKRQKLGADAFEPPKGYKKRELPSMGR